MRPHEARLTAASVLTRVLDEGAYSQRAIDAALERSDLDQRDRAWIAAAVYGTLTQLRAIDLALGRALDRGLESLPPKVRALLRIAVWETTRGGRGATAPVVNATVDSVRLQKPRALGPMSNAVLRSVIRDRDVIFAPPTRATDAARLGVEFGLPDWIVESLCSTLGADAAREAMAAFNAPTHVTVRVLGGDRDGALRELSDDGFEVEPHPFAGDAITCTSGRIVASRAHREGRVVVQDAGAQMAIDLLPRDIDGAVLDACAGLGGKTIALRDRFPNQRIVATDRSPAKLAVLNRTAGTSGVETAAWSIGDEEPPTVVREASFAAVVVDAPCTALGTIGRHPEVRWRRQPADVKERAELQRRILDAVAGTVADGGWLLYIVCTWTSEESDAVIGDFVRDHPQFSIVPPTHDDAPPGFDWGAHVDDGGVVRLWPHTTASDAFAVARLRRQR